MRWEKVVVIAMLAYMAVALPAYILNNQDLQQCHEACIEEGFNMSLGATRFGEEEGIECRCFNSYGRTEGYITIGGS